MEKSRKNQASRQKTATRTADRTIAIEATRLLGKWLRLAQGHVSFGMHCSCGMAASNSNIQVQDFELQILDYLFSKHNGPPGEQGFAMLRARASYLPGKTGSITNLLRAIAAEAPELESEPQLALLHDLARSIESFDEFHGG